MNDRGFKSVLITGVTGSGGSYLAEYVVHNQPATTVHGLCRWHSTSVNSNLDAVSDKVVLHECDLNDLSSVIRALEASRPDGIFHLASHANVRVSFNSPLSVMENNIMGTAKLFEAVRLLQMDPVIQLCSTSEVYGQVSKEDVPIKENCPLNPASPYAVSKVAQDLLGQSYFYSYGMKVIRTRMFAYLNPRRSDLFATSFVMQVARIEAGLQKELVHGNLDSVRTLIDVRDAMESYWVALNSCDYGQVYNIGGPTTITVGEFLELLKAKAHCPIPSRVDPKLLRPSDVTLQIPDVSKFHEKTKWSPKYSFEDSVNLLLDHCRRQIV